MSLDALVMLFSSLLLTAPATPAVPPPAPVAAEVGQLPERITSPTRRCREAIDRRAASPPAAQARCEGAFGLPGAKGSGQVDGELRERALAFLATRGDR